MAEEKKEKKIAKKTAKAEKKAIKKQSSVEKKAKKIANKKSKANSKLVDNKITDNKNVELLPVNEGSVNSTESIQAEKRPVKTIQDIFVNYKPKESSEVVQDENVQEGIDEPLIDSNKENSTYSSDDNFEARERMRRIKAPRIIPPKEEPLLRRNKKSKEEKKEIIRYNTDIRTGLTAQQIAERKEHGLINVVNNKNNKTYRSIIFGNIFTFFNLLCFLVAAALMSVGSFGDCFFMVIVLANTLIGIIQEIKAKKTIEKISLVSSPTAIVIRDGEEIKIPIDEILLDDIMALRTGKQICADSIVVDGSVEVNESLLTGESVSVKKNVGDMLYSGSFVVGGKCLSKVERIGNDTYTARLASQAKQYQKPKSELMGTLNVIISIVGAIIIPIAILMFFNNYNQLNEDIASTVEKTAGSIIGMIPSGMFLLTSMALAVGVIKLAKKRTLVQDLYSIEMLARTDVLCLDKTGTITDGTMKVGNVIQIKTDFKYTIDQLIGSMLTALDDNNQTSRALITHFGYSKDLTPLKVLPFNSTRKMSAVTFTTGETFVFGAPEFVLKTKNAQVDNMVKNYASKGFRVLMVAECEGEIKDDKISAKRTPIALIIIEDHIREDAQETIAWFKNNGVDIKIISGDNPITVSEVSRRVGVENAEKYISLEGLSQQQVIDAADKYTVFGRVSPEQKCILVKALKAKGQKVAMTGDGVNDILALKEADCSIAMASGSEATRLVSNLVLMDSNFASMPSVVAEGRRVINNVQKSSSLFLMKTIFTILLSVFCLIVKMDYPFTTKQVMLLEFLVIGIPSFALALQPNNDKINGKFLANVLSKSLPGAIILFINVISCYLFDVGIGTDGEFQTMASLTITFVGLLVLYRLCQPFDLFRGVMYTAMITLCVVVLSSGTFIDFFEFVPMTLQNTLFIICLVLASYPAYNFIVKWLDKLVNIKSRQ